MKVIGTEREALVVKDVTSSRVIGIWINSRLFGISVRVVVVSGINVDLKEV